MANRRRQRFVATYSTPIRNNMTIEVLSYPEFVDSYMKNWAARRGFEIVSIVPKARAVQTPKPEQDFSIDKDALDRAIQMLGIKHPVKIRLHARYGGTNGNHLFRRQGGYHDIMVKRYLTAHEANKTLWHELTHAVQTERLGPTEFNKQYAMAGRSGRKYRMNPFEVEANRVSEEFAPQYPLCRA